MVLTWAWSLVKTSSGRPQASSMDGIEGAFMSRLLGRVRRKMLSEGFPAVLADMGDDGRLRPGSTLRAKS